MRKGEGEWEGMREGEKHTHTHTHTHKHTRSCMHVCIAFALTFFLFSLHDPKHLYTLQTLDSQLESLKHENSRLKMALATRYVKL